MQSTVRTFETADNTYYMSYGRIAKTSYEQQEERRAERNYMIMQRLIGIGFIALCIALSILIPDPELRGCLLFIGLPIGLLVTVTKQKAFVL